jgi:hypothetical protein
MLSSYSLFRVRKRTKQNLSPSTDFLIITKFARAAVTGRWHTCSYSLSARNTAKTDHLKIATYNPHTLQLHAKVWKIQISGLENMWDHNAK